MPIDERQFRAKPVLDSLRQHCGDSDFGYRMQGLFAHVLLRLGARIIEVNAHGHPDVKAQLGDRTLNVQVKAALHGEPTFQFDLAAKDLAGIRSPSGIGGYLAMLDCAEPVSWILVHEMKLVTLLGQSVRMATLRADRDTLFSQECTDEFLDLVITHADRVFGLTFRILANRALRGETL